MMRAEATRLQVGRHTKSKEELCDELEGADSRHTHCGVMYWDYLIGDDHEVGHNFGLYYSYQIEHNHHDESLFDRMACRPPKWRCATSHRGSTFYSTS
jgi:hypothetical protein